MLLFAGTDYKKTPIELREMLSVDGEKARQLLKAAKKIEGINGCAVLSTCNRTEIYISAEDFMPADSILFELTNTDKEQFKDKINMGADIEVVYHLFETACGINSAMQGETQIISQISLCADLSRECDCMCPELDVLFRTAISTARKAVSDFSQTYRITSACQAVERLEKMCGSLVNKNCVVIGNGKVGLLAASLLKDKGAAVTITLRKYKHGENIIPPGCDFVYYDKRISVIDGCDILISATKSPHFTLTDSMTENIKLPQYIVDLSVPRDIDPNICKNNDITYLNIDDFTSQNQVDEKVYQIVDMGVSEYIGWYNYRESISDINIIKDIAAQRIIKATGYDENTVKVVAEKTVDMLLGGMKSVITPQVIQECGKKIKDRSRL